MKSVFMMIIILVVSFSLFSQTAIEPAAGDGTANNPYQITNLGNLYWVADQVNDVLEGETFSGQHFIQTEDIDASSTVNWFDGQGWYPVGISVTQSFRGTYNGQGYTIDGLYINRDNLSRVGLFGILRNATIRNLSLVDFEITGRNSVGGIAGRTESSTIINSSGTGNITGGQQIGGLLGSSENTSVINCYSSVVVTGDDSENSTGGLIGRIVGVDSEVLHSYSMGSVTGGSNVGGLIGNVVYNVDISDSYSHASVEGVSRVGGLVGLLDASSIYRSYSSGLVNSSDSYLGGLIGRNISSTVLFSYWDIMSSGQTTSDGGTGKTTAEMYQQETYNNYNFVSLWEIEEGINYPGFRDLSLYSLPQEIDLEDLQGSGDLGDPFLITDMDELNAMRQGLTKHFQLANDIDLHETVVWNSSKGWLPVGCTNEAFSGSFDGNGHIISNLIINNPKGNYQGLFGYAENAVFSNVVLHDANMQVGSNGGGLAGKISHDSHVEQSHFHGYILSSEENVGGLVGTSEKSTIINSSAESTVVGVDNTGGVVGNNHSSLVNECYSNSNVTGVNFNVGGLVGKNSQAIVENSSSEGQITSLGNSSGGLVGRNESESTIINSHSTASVDGYIYAGGLIGTNFSQSTVSHCYSSGEITGFNSVGGFAGYNSDHSTIQDSYSNSKVSYANNWVGGFVGNNSEGATIQNCFSTGHVYGQSIVGGFVGWNRTDAMIINSYSTGFVTGNVSLGGFIGYLTNGTVTNSYWDIDTSGQATSDGGEGRTTSQMTHPYDADTYVEWDFVEIWEADYEYNLNHGYPYLREVEVSADGQELLPVTESISLRNYPNPFNPETTISFSLTPKQVGDRVTVDIYNIKGQKVYTLFDDYATQKENSLVWDGRDYRGRSVASGVYLYRLVTPDESVTNKMMLLK